MSKFLLTFKRLISLYLKHSFKLIKFKNSNLRPKDRFKSAQRKYCLLMFNFDITSAMIIFWINCYNSINVVPRSVVEVQSSLELSQCRYTICRIIVACSSEMMLTWLPSAWSVIKNGDNFLSLAFISFDIILALRAYYTKQPRSFNIQVSGNRSKNTELSITLIRINPYFYWFTNCQ